jgi:hypothetical protein
MYIFIAGGGNDIDGALFNFTKKRLERFYELYESYKHLNPKIIISGGFRFSKISHCELIKNEILQKYPNILIEKEFIENNDTIDEAINISEYLSLKKYMGKLIIITSNWHMNRIKYLFNQTFKRLNNVEIEYINTFEEDNTFIEEEKEKLNILKTNSYGKWKKYMML